MPKKQSKKHKPNKQTKHKKVRSGGIVSNIINLDDILKSSIILKPFITNNSINYQNIDNFIKDRLDSLIESFSVSPNESREPVSIIN